MRHKLQHCASAPLIGTVGKSKGARWTQQSAPLFAAEVPRTVTPTALRVAREDDTMFQNNWHAVLVGEQRISLPYQVDAVNTDGFVEWYQERELKKRTFRRPEADHMGQRHKMMSRHSIEGCGVTPKRPDGLLERIKDAGWSERAAGSVWAQQARALAVKRFAVAATPSIARDRALHVRLALLEHLETEGIKQGAEAFRAALSWKCGSLKKAFACLDFHGQGWGPSLMEFTGGIALLGLNTPALSGCDERVFFKRLDKDGDGLIGLSDMESGGAPLPEEEPQIKDVLVDEAPKVADPAVPSLEKMSDADPDAAVAALVRGVVLSPPRPGTLFRNNLPAAAMVAVAAETGEKLKISDFSTCSVADSDKAARDAIAAGTSSSDICAVLQASLTSGVSIKRPMNSHPSTQADGSESERAARRRARKANLRPPVDKWVLIAKFVANSAWWNTPATLRWRGRTAPPKRDPLIGGSFVEKGVPQRLNSVPPLAIASSNIETESWAPSPDAVNRQVLASTAEELDTTSKQLSRADESLANMNNRSPNAGRITGAAVTAVREAALVSLACGTVGAGGGDSGALARQQVLDEFRRSMSPDESDLDEARALLKEEFPEWSTVTQYGENLVSRKDVCRVLGDLFPRDAPHHGSDEGMSVACDRVGRIYDEVLELQVSLASFEGRALSRGLTFDSFRIVLYKVAIVIGLDFRYIVVDAVESLEEIAQKRRGVKLRPL